MWVLGKGGRTGHHNRVRSLTCDHCKRFHLQMLPRLEQTYIDTGTAKLIYRHFPLDRVALMFFGLFDALFRREDLWAHSKDPKTELANIALLAGIKRSAFEACLADDNLSTAIRRGQSAMALAKVHYCAFDGVGSSHLRS